MQGIRQRIVGIRQLENRLEELSRNLESLRVAIGRIEARQSGIAELGKKSEFQVFSQWGEDGIIHKLTRDLNIPAKIFIEFGVESYREANTRFLLMQENWSGLVIDGDAENILSIRRSPLYWRHNLKAVHAFVTRENINCLIEENGISGEIGLLSIDIDGVDYWVWQALDCVTPAIVVVEYNSLFGAERSVTVPYESGFIRSKSHPSNLYYGASLGALAKLGVRKGYALVCCNQAGNNAFFVRKDLLPDGSWEKSVQEAFVARQFREGRDANGKLIFGSPEEESLVACALPLEEVV